MAKKRGLGRSMGALLEGVSAQNENNTRTPAGSVVLEPENSREREASTDASGSGVAPGSRSGELPGGESLRLLPIELIRPGTYQPRQNFDQEALQELADSLLVQGMIQPVLVRPFADGYELIAGERRWRAAQLARLQEIPAIVRELDDQSVAAVSLIENIQRKDLNPLEEARAFQRLQEEFGMTHQSVADAVGRSRAAVSNLLRLLDLQDGVKVMLDKGELGMGHARALLAADARRQLALATRVIEQGLSVRATEKLVRQDGESPVVKVAPSRRDPDIVTLETSLGDTLGAAVSIRHQDTGKGKLEISYNSLDELEGILAHIS